MITRGQMTKLYVDLGAPGKNQRTVCEKLQIAEVFKKCIQEKRLKEAGAERNFCSPLMVLDKYVSVVYCLFCSLFSPGICNILYFISIFLISIVSTYKSKFVLYFTNLPLYLAK